MGCRDRVGPRALGNTPISGRRRLSALDPVEGSWMAVSLAYAAPLKGGTKVTSIRVGAKFPAILEQRLGECKVMLVFR